MKENPWHFQPSDIEQLKELGSRLQQSREEKLLSVEQIAQDTHIRISLIKAIEEARLNELPEPIYLKALIRRYADRIGLDPEELAKAVPEPSVPIPTRSFWPSISIGQISAIHLYIVYIFIVIGAVNALSNLVKSSALEAATQTHLEPPPPPKPPTTPLQAVSYPSTNDNKPVKVGVIANDSSWVKVIADGKTQFEGLLKQGDQKIWEAKEQLTVKTKNAGGVLITFNNGQAKKLGVPGQAQEVTFAPSSQF